MAKVAKVRTRKRGKTWSYSFEIGEVAGVRKRREKGGFPTKEAAYEAGIKAYADWKHGNIGITERIKLSDYINFWMNTICTMSVSDSTRCSYWTYIRNHISPDLGSIVLQDLTPAMVDRWVRRLVTEKGLAYKSILVAFSILNKALKYAVHPGQLISSNPAAYVEIPHSAPRNLVPRIIITQERLNSLLDTYPAGHPVHIPIWILYHTGMRLGEMLALRWEDVDLNNATISIHRQIRYIYDRHGYYIRGTKTVSSIRTIYIDPDLISALSAHRKRQKKAEMKAGKTYIYNYSQPDGRIISQSKALSVSDQFQREDLICTKSSGLLVIPNTVMHALAKEGLNSHSFRHTQATILIENGASPKGVARRLGHANVNITQNLYTHDTPKLRQDTADIFWQSQCRQKPYVDKM